MLKIEQYLPTVIMLLSFAASAIYLFAGDWRKALYYFAAGLIYVSLTF